MNIKIENISSSLTFHAQRRRQEQEELETIQVRLIEKNLSSTLQYLLGAPSIAR